LTAVKATVGAETRALASACADIADPVRISAAEAAEKKRILVTLHLSQTRKRTKAFLPPSSLPSD
jgi:hypothetical protein